MAVPETDSQLVHLLLLAWPETSHPLLAVAKSPPSKGVSEQAAQLLFSAVTG